MYKEGIVLLSSLLLLAACGEETKDPDIEETTDEVEEVESEEKEETVGTEEADPIDAELPSNDVSHPYNGLVNETTFTEAYGLQAWDDYTTIVEESELGEITVVNEEGTTLEDLDGTTSAEIAEMLDASGLRGDVFQEEVELSETEKMILYRYPPAEDSDYTDMADFLAEMTFYYVGDHLMFSSVTPGFYSLELNNAPSTNEYIRMLKVEEIEEINPPIYTIAQMQINGEKIEQIMTPAMEVNEEGEEVLVAFYFFTKGEDILQYAYIPFEMVSQDFPTNSVLLFYELIPELEQL